MKTEAVVRGGVLQSFAIFKRKHLCWSHSLTKLQARRLQHSCFDSIIAQFLGTAVLWNASGDWF